MNTSKKPKIATFPVVLALLALLPVRPGAFQLQDIQLASGQGQMSLKLTFAKTGADVGEYPLYFQKVDPSRGSLTLSFLDTESPFPYGRHPVDAANPALEEVFLKRVTSPSGKSFLGIELRLKEPPAGEAPVQPQPKGALKVLLGAGSGAGGKPAKANWSLAKSLKARDGYLTAQAEAPPAAPPEPVPNKVEARPAEPPPAAAAPEAAAPGAAESAASPAASGESGTAAEASVPVDPGAPASLKEIRMAIARSQEDVSLVFEPESALPVHTAQPGSGDSTVLEVVLDGVSTALPRKEYVLPGSGLFKRVRVDRRGGDLVLRFQTVSGAPVHILPKAGSLTLTGAGKGESATPFKWTTARPDAAPPVAAAEPVPSAHEEGAALDAAGTSRKPGKGLSSSRTFSVGKGGKSMILLKDSAALKEAPAPKAGTRKKLPLGEKVERIDREGAWIKVIAAGDTGYIRAADAVYEDEMSEAQAGKLRKDREAAAAARAAAAQAAAAQAAAAQAAAEAAAQAEAARAEAGKLKAEEAAAQAAVVAAREAAAAKAAAAEAEPVRVAGPAAAVGRPADGPRLSLAESPELADKLAQEKKRAEEEKLRTESAENRVAYNSYGRRDPFIPVEQGQSDNGIDIDQMKVVGIIWQAQEPMAVLEHNRESGVSFTVKQGDPVHNGRVSRITRDQVTFDISEYGISRSYSLKLVSNKEGKKQ